MCEVSEACEACKEAERGAGGWSGNANVSSPGDMGTSDILDIIPVGEPDMSVFRLKVGSNGESMSDCRLGVVFLGR